MPGISFIISLIFFQPWINQHEGGVQASHHWTWLAGWNRHRRGQARWSACYERRHRLEGFHVRHEKPLVRAMSKQALKAAEYGKIPSLLVKPSCLPAMGGDEPCGTCVSLPEGVDGMHATLSQAI